MVDVWDSVLPAGPSTGTPAAVLGIHVDENYSEEQERALFVFRYLLVFVAALESFAHGANDTGNATGASSSACINNTFMQ
jgi:sodium-dependent phosphate transporter